MEKTLVHGCPDREQAVSARWETAALRYVFHVKRVLRTTTRIGLIATPILGIVLLLAVMNGLNQLLNVVYILVPACIAGFIPLIVGQLVLYASQLRRASIAVQLFALLVSWFVSFVVVIHVMSLWALTSIDWLAQAALISTAVMVVIHGLIAATVVVASRSSRAASCGTALAARWVRTAGAAPILRGGGRRRPQPNHQSGRRPSG